MVKLVLVLRRSLLDQNVGAIGDADPAAHRDVLPPAVARVDELAPVAPWVDVDIALALLVVPAPAAVPDLDKSGELRAPIDVVTPGAQGADGTVPVRVSDGAHVPGVVVKRVVVNVVGKVRFAVDTKVDLELALVATPAFAEVVFAVIAAVLSTPVALRN